MIVPKGSPLELGRRGKFRDILKSLSASNFSGYVEVSYRKNELSKAKVLFINGKLAAAGVQRLLSKTEVVGKRALEELLALESCVVDIYTLNERDAAKALEWNKNAIVEKLPEEEAKSEEGITEEIISTPSEREAILRKYNIRMPSPEEIDQIIINALDGSYDLISTEISTPSDLASLKKSMEDIADLYLGKMSKKVVDIIKECKSREEIAERFDEIRNAAKSLVIFVPRKKIEEMLSEMEKLMS